MGASYNEEGESWCHRHCWIFFVAFLASWLVILWYLIEAGTPAEYTIAITGVSGLDRPAAVPSDSTKQGGVLVNPTFNLTFGITSKTRFAGACIDPHTIMKVSYSYLDLPLASGSVPSVCVGPRESSDLLAVVAKGSNVAVPGFLIDTLAEEMRSGTALFQVEINAYVEDHGHWLNLWSLWVPAGDVNLSGPRAMHSVVVDQ